MQQIQKINHVGLRISRLQQTRAFYEKLGFVFVAGPLGPEPVAIMEHPSGITINFIVNAQPREPQNILMDIPDKRTGYTHIALEVGNLDIVERQLTELGIAITEGPISTPEGARLLFIRDPDGNVVEFHLPAPKPEYNL